MATVKGSTGVGGGYTAALGNKVLASVTSQARNFGRGVMGAAMGQMPGVQAASGYFSQLPGSIGSFGGGGGSGTTANVSSMAAMVKEQKQANVISLQTVRELRGLRSDTTAQTRITEQMSRNLQKGISDVNKTMREVKKAVEDGGGGDGGGILDSVGDALKGIGSALGVGAGALFVSSAINTFNKPNPRNRRSQTTYARRVADNVQRRLMQQDPAKTSTITSLYGRDRGGGGGATLRERFGAVAVTDTEQLKATKVQTDVTRKGLKELAVGIEKVGRNTGYSGIREIQERRARETRLVKSPEDKIREEAQAKFLKDINNLNAKVFKDTIKKIVGTDYTRNVTQRDAAGEKYLGKTISQATGFQKGMERTFEKLLGKEYGGAYGRIFANLGEAYIQAQAQSFGKSLFTSALGSEEKARVLTGQIVGNLAKGNKQVATEQLLYGFTGEATGIETVMAKYGFATTEQGIQYTGNMLAAGATAGIKNMTGFNGEYVAISDPVTGEKTIIRDLGTMMNAPMGAPPVSRASTSSSIPATASAPYTPMYSSSYNAGNYIEMPYDDKGTRAGVVTTLGYEDNKRADAQLKTSYELIDTTAEGLGATAGASLATGKIAGEGFKASIQTDVETSKAIIQSERESTQYLAQVIASQPRGGGGTTVVAGGMPGGNFGNFLVDMGASIVANKLTTGIKNPYMRAIANYGLVTGGKSVLNTFRMGGGNYLGNLDTALFGAGGLSGFTSGIASGVGNLAGTIAGPATLLPVSQAAPITNAVTTTGTVLGGGAGAAAPAIGTSAGATGAGVAGTTSSYAGGNIAASQASASTVNTSAASAAGTGTMATIGGTLAAISALQQFSSGDPVGGTGSALIAAGAFMGPAGAPLMIIGVGLNILSSVFGFGRKKPPPPPTHGAHRAMMIEGNNNINAKETLTYYGSKTPDAGIIAICDEYLNIAFNTIKTFEIRGIRTSPPIMWLQHAAAQRQDGKTGNMWLAVYTTEFDASNPTDTSKAALVIHFGQPRHASGADAAKIVNELGKFYEENSATSKLDIDKALKNLRSSAYFEIAFNKAKGLEDLEKVEAGLFAENLETSRLIADYKLKESGKKPDETKQSRFSFGQTPSTDMFKNEMKDTGYDQDAMEPIQSPTGRRFAWNPLTNKYDILVEDPTTGLTISSTGKIVSAEKVVDVKGALALLTDQELVSIAGPYARQGPAWLRTYYNSWLASDWGSRTGMKSLNDMLKKKGYESNLRVSVGSMDGGDGYPGMATYDIFGLAYQYASGTQSATQKVVAFDPVRNQAIFDVNQNDKFDISDIERYYEQNPIPVGTDLGKAGGIVSIAPSSNDNSTTVNNYGMGTSNAQDPFRSQRTNTRPSLLSLAA